MNMKTMPILELIRTTAHCGRLIRKARHDLDPESYQLWSRHSHDYVSARVCAMWYWRNQVAQIANLLFHHQCRFKPDHVIVAPFEMAIRLDDAMRKYASRLIPIDAE